MLVNEPNGAWWTSPLGSAENSRRVQLVNAQEYLSGQYQQAGQTIVVAGVVYNGEGGECIRGIPVGWSPIFEKRARKYNNNDEMIDTKFFRKCQPYLAQWYQREKELFSESVLLKVLQEFCSRELDADAVLRMQGRKSRAEIRSSDVRSRSRTPPPRGHSEKRDEGGQWKRTDSVATTDDDETPSRYMSKMDSRADSCYSDRIDDEGATLPRRRTINQASATRGGGVGGERLISPEIKSPPHSTPQYQKSGSGLHQANGSRDSLGEMPAPPAEVPPPLGLPDKNNGNGKIMKPGEGKTYRLTSLDARGQRDEREVSSVAVRIAAQPGGPGTKEVWYIPEMLVGSECEQLLNFVSKALEAVPLGQLADCCFSRCPTTDAEVCVLKCAAAPHRELQTRVPKELRENAGRYVNNFARMFAGCLEVPETACIAMSVEMVPTHPGFTWALHGQNNSTLYTHCVCALNQPATQNAAPPVMNIEGDKIPLPHRTAVIQKGRGAVVQSLTIPAAGEGGIKQQPLFLLRLTFL